MIRRFAIAIVFVLLFFITLFGFWDVYLFLPCLLFAGFFIVNALRLFYTCIRGDYISVSGTCVQVETTAIRKRVKSLTLEYEEEEPRLLTVSICERMKRLSVGDEVLMILVSLALLTFICRLWPILLLIILGIFVAAIRLLFLSGNRVDQVEPQPLLPAPIPAPTESDLRKLAHSLITSRITTLVLNEYPNARWIWEAPNAFELIELGEEVYILLNRDGGYRKAKVIIQNLQVIGLQYQEIPKKPDESEERTEAPATEQPKENYELIAFEWAESHIFELNARCNDAIGQGLTEIILTADDLPARESWENVCLELQRTGLEDAVCIAEGIKINLSH